MKYCRIIIRLLNKDEVTLLLYTLILKIDEFKAFVILESDYETFLCSILEIINEFIGVQMRYSQLYTLLSLILVLSQEPLFVQKIHDIQVLIPRWFVERMESSISLGGLLMLIIIRVVQSNLSKHRDAYIHVNCLAILGNMSSKVKNMPAVVSFRFVNLFESVAKKYWKYKSDGNLYSSESVRISSLISLGN